MFLRFGRFGSCILVEIAEIKVWRFCWNFIHSDRRPLSKNDQLAHLFSSLSPLGIRLPEQSTQKMSLGSKISFFLSEVQVPQKLIFIICLPVPEFLLLSLFVVSLPLFSLALSFSAPPPVHAEAPRDSQLTPAVFSCSPPFCHQVVSSFLEGPEKSNQNNLLLLCYGVASARILCYFIFAL